MNQKELRPKILNEYLEMDMRTWDNNIKMDIKFIIFIFRLHSSLQHGESWSFGKVKKGILQKYNKCIQKFYT